MERNLAAPRNQNLFSLRYIYDFTLAISWIRHFSTAFDILFLFSF
jgi:hypothetical protein